MNPNQPNSGDESNEDFDIFRLFDEDRPSENELELAIMPFYPISDVDRPSENELERAFMPFYRRTTATAAAAPPPSPPPLPAPLRTRQPVQQPTQPSNVGGSTDHNESNVIVVPVNPEDDDLLESMLSLYNVINEEPGSAPAALPQRPDDTLFLFNQPLEGLGSGSISGASNVNTMNNLNTNFRLDHIQKSSSAPTTFTSGSSSSSVPVENQVFRRREGKAPMTSSMHGSGSGSGPGMGQVPMPGSDGVRGGVGNHRLDHEYHQFGAVLALAAVPGVCRDCLLLRSLVHTHGLAGVTRFEVHGSMDGQITHGVLSRTRIVRSPSGNSTTMREVGTHDFRGQSLIEVNDYLVDYLVQRVREGFILHDDPLGPMYAANQLAFTGLLRPRQQQGGIQIQPPQPSAAAGEGAGLGATFPRQQSFHEQIFDQYREYVRRAANVPLVFHDRPPPPPPPPPTQQPSETSKKVEVNLSEQRKKVKNMSFVNMSKYFHLPLKQASVKFGVCDSTVKKRLRKFNVKPWPYRKVNSINRRIECLGGREGALRGPHRQIIKQLIQELDRVYRRRTTASTVFNSACSPSSSSSHNNTAASVAPAAAGDANLDKNNNVNDDDDDDGDGNPNNNNNNNINDKNNNNYNNQGKDEGTS